MSDVDTTPTATATVYVPAHDADEAKERAFRYFRTGYDYRVFTVQADSEEEAAHMGKHFNPGYWKTFAVSLNAEPVEG